jgi:spermidine synthase
MNPAHRIPYREQISLGLLSAAIITFQLVLMEILSYVQWYHFAYMVISIALLGFGAAGTALSLFRSKLMAKFDIAVPLLIISSGLLMSVNTQTSQLRFARFDTYMFFSDYSQILNLLLTYLLFFLPFFTGALAIGMFFVKHAQNIGKIYFANLVGSGIGGIAAIFLVWKFLPDEFPAVVSVLPVISGLLLISKRTKRVILFPAVISSIIIAYSYINPAGLVMSEFKSLSKTLQLPEAKIITEKNSPYGLVQVVTSPVLRFAPGLSLQYKNTIPVQSAVFNNGNWLMPVISFGENDTTEIIDYTTHSLPYATGQRENVLILNHGSGLDVAGAIAHNADNIILVESNPLVTSLLKNELAFETDSLYYNKTIAIKNIESRTFLMSDTSKYDLITIPIVGSFEGSSGLYAMQEQYLLTKESVSEMRELLKPNGVICITCWIDYPFRNPLKVLSTLAEASEENSSEAPFRFIAAVRSWGTITFILKCSPITQEESEQIREFCREMFFDPVILPDIKPGERSQFNQVQDEKFFDYIDEILSPGRNQLYTEYDFYLKPATDDKPFFSQFLRLNNIPHLSELFGTKSIPYFETGYVFALFTLIQVSIASIVIILLPLFKLGFKGKNKLKVLLYFSGIGIGYMAVEIVLIQRFILYFGNAIYSAAAVISSLLICSGIGSNFSSRINLKKNYPATILIIIAALLLLYTVLLTPVISETITFPLVAKYIFALAIIAPLSFLMGLPFPLGIRTLSAGNKEQIPWAWGINGSFSVISSTAAAIIAVELGFSWVMIIASAAYLLPLTANMK